MSAPWPRAARLHQLRDQATSLERRDLIDAALSGDRWALYALAVEEAARERPIEIGNREVDRPLDLLEEITRVVDMVAAAEEADPREWYASAKRRACAFRTIRELVRVHTVRP